MGQHSLQHMYDAYQRVHDAQQAERRRAGVRLTALQRHLGITPGAERSAHQNEVSQSSGFKRIAQCRKALEALDRRWGLLRPRYMPDLFRQRYMPGLLRPRYTGP